MLACVIEAVGLERLRLRAAFSAQMAHSFSGKLKNGPRLWDEVASCDESESEDMPSADLAGAGRTREMVSRGCESEAIIVETKRRIVRCGNKGRIKRRNS